MKIRTSSYHTHTYLCKHATGTPADYVESARGMGCTALGFSDHCPFPANGGDIWQHVKMEPEETALYVKMVREAAEIADFPVYLGFECEYDTVFDSWYKDFLIAEHGAQYLVLGQHWVPDGSVRHYIPEVVDDRRLLYRYTDLTIKAMQTGLFAFLAHPDVMMAKGSTEWNPEIKACLSALVECAVDCDMPIEINGYGFLKDKVTTKSGEKRAPYPFREFWEMAAASSVKVICNSDAHRPENVLAPTKICRDFAAELGIKPLDTLPIAVKL